MEAPGLGQHAGIARHDKVPGRGHLHDHHHARDMSNKRNHGDESNRVPYIEQPWKLVCNKMTPTDKAEKHMHPPPADTAAAPSVLGERRPDLPDPGGRHGRTVYPIERRPDPPGPRRIPPLRCLPLVGTSLSHPTLGKHRGRTVCPPASTTTALSASGKHRDRAVCPRRAPRVPPMHSVGCAENVLIPPFRTPAETSLPEITRLCNEKRNASSRLPIPASKPQLARNRNPCLLDPT